MSIIRFNKTTNTIRQVLTLFCVVIIRTCGFCIFCAEENGFIIFLAKISKEILFLTNRLDHNRGRHANPVNLGGFVC